ncbi:MAG: MG2 domain-containing protein [Candidatus Altiarchaeota archaeon]
MGLMLRTIFSLLLVCTLLSSGASAFSKIKPQLAATGMSADGFFTVIFTNGVGAPIRLTGVGAKNLLSGGQCVGVSEYTQGYIPHGENFQVVLSGCNEGYSTQVGDIYNVGIRLDYEVTIAGQKSTHSDGGTIRGPVEDPSGKPTILAGSVGRGGGSFMTDDFARRAGAFFFELPRDPDSLALNIVVIAAVVGYVIFKTEAGRQYRKGALIAAAVIIVAAGVFASYVTNIDQNIRMQQTLLMSQGVFMQDSTASMRIVAVDMKTLAPLAQAPVRIELTPKTGPGRAVFSGVTDETGSAEISFTLPASEWPEGEYGLRASVGEDTYLGSVEVRGESAALLTTDKPLYQPGQEIHMRALLINPFSRKPITQEPATFEVEDSKANKIFKKSALTDRFGIASADLLLADDINLGAYKVRVLTDKGGIEKKVDVKKYALPKFKVSFMSDKRYYAPGDRLKASVSSAYFFGKPVSDADVHVSVLDGRLRTVREVQGRPDEKGAFDFAVDIPAPSGEGESFLAFNATVIDSTGHSEATLAAVPVSSEKLTILALPEAERLRWGMENNVYIIAAYPDGRPAELDLEVNGERIRTNRLGVAAYTATPQGSGEYRLDISADDGKGTSARAVRTLQADQAGEHMVLKTDRQTYSVGDRMQVECVYSGQYSVPAAYLDVVKGGQTILTKSVPMSQNRGSAEIDVTQEMSGALYLACYKASSTADMVKDGRAVFVGDGAGLEVRIMPDKPVYLPGSDARIDIQVEGDGQGVPSALELKIVDESVFALEKAAGNGANIIPGSGLPQPVVALPFDINEAEGDRYALAALIAASNVSGADYALKADSYADKAMIVNNLKGRYDAFFARLAGSLIWYAVAVGVIVLVLWGIASAVRGGGAGLIILFFFIFFFMGVVWWQLGIFNMNSGSTTSTGGFDSSISTEGQGRAFEKAALTRQEATSSKPYLRQYFPETLYYNPEVITDEEGRAHVSLIMADSITTWRASAFASSPDGRLGSNDTGIRVFQDFFIDLDLPRILTQDDEIWVPVAVYNYLDTGQDVKIEIEPAEWYQLLDEGNKTVSLGPGDVTSVNFHIKAKKHGLHKLTAYGFGAAMSDALSKPVEVKPYGQEITETATGVLNDDMSEIVDIPPIAVDGTGKITAKFYQGYFSQVIDGMESMLQMPYGCFEQTTSVTYPNILILKYMKKTGQSTPEIQKKAEGYIGTGYQRLLKFETSTPGGFDWYGNPPPKLLLTAYGLMEFKDMSDVYDIDPALIARTQKWLASQQKSDGSWEPTQSLHMAESMANNRLTSTCFVYWSLAHSGYGGSEMARANTYIRNNIGIDKNQDPYTLAVCANGLIEADKKDATALRILQELESMKVQEGNATYWPTPPGLCRIRQLDGVEGRLQRPGDRGHDRDRIYDWRLQAGDRRVGAELPYHAQGRQRKLGIHPGDDTIHESPCHGSRKHPAEGHRHGGFNPYQRQAGCKPRI